MNWTLRTYQPTGRIFAQIEERTTIPDSSALRGLAIVAALRGQARSILNIVAIVVTHFAQFFVGAFA